MIEISFGMIAELKYIKQFENLYPGIDIWMKSRVLVQLEKRYWIVNDTGNIAGMVVIDLIQGKLCHLSVSKNYRKRRVDIGRFLYLQAMEEFRSEGVNEIFAHGTEKVVRNFRFRFPGWIVIGDLGGFGRAEHDQLIKLNLKVGGS